jgi:O-antigen/teichoic acid export membrane protein
MRSRLLRRRAATAAGLYASVALGIAATIVAARGFEKEEFARFAVVLAAASFFQLMLDLTVEDALTKYGFRYATAGDWGKLRRLFQVATRLKLLGGVLAGAVLVAIAPIADWLFSDEGLASAFLVAALLPLVQCTENVSTSALLLRERYDVRGAYQAVAQAGRLLAVALGVRHGVTWTIAAIVIAQALATAGVWIAGRIALQRFPRVATAPLDEDVPGLRAFVVQSSLATGLVSIRTTAASLILGVVAGASAVGVLRIALAPQSGFAAASSPVRLILLAEQTRDWERGRERDVLAGVRRYMLCALAIAVVSVPVFLAAMPWLVTTVFGDKWTEATEPARIVLVAAAIQLVFGWSKSFPTTIGRPGLRIVTHGIETAVLLPVTALLGARFGVDGAAFAILASSVVFALVWTVLLRRIRFDSAARVAAREAQAV